MIVMNNPTSKVAVGYAIWVSINLLIAIFHIGDAGVSSHLALLFTGFPAALPSLALKHASLQAVALAGVLGLVQWCAITWFYTLWLRKGKPTGGAFHVKRNVDH